MSDFLLFSLLWTWINNQEPHFKDIWSHVWSLWTSTREFFFSAMYCRHTKTVISIHSKLVNLMVFKDQACSNYLTTSQMQHVFDDVLPTETALFMSFLFNGRTRTRKWKSWWLWLEHSYMRNVFELTLWEQLTNVQTELIMTLLEICDIPNKGLERNRCVVLENMYILTRHPWKMCEVPKETFVHVNSRL